MFLKIYLLKYCWFTMCNCVAVISYSCVCVLNPTAIPDCSYKGSSIWDSPGKNTKLGYHCLLRDTSRPRGSNWVSCHWRADSSPLATWDVDLLDTFRCCILSSMVYQILTIVPCCYAVGPCFCILALLPQLLIHPSSVSSLPTHKMYSLWVCLFIR